MISGEIEVQLRKLIHREKLDDFARLLEPRELDEVPLVSRYKHIEFLSPLSAVDKTEALTVCAARYLAEIVEHVDPQRRSNTVIMVSITRWEDLDDSAPEPALPNFWICGDKKRDLGQFRLAIGHSSRAQLVMEWLRHDGLDGRFAVYDSVSLGDKNGRVYLALREDPTVVDLIVP
jgi:hypothetical protein